MKKTIIALISFLGATASFAQPKAYFPETTHNFGAFAEEDGLARCEFAMVNEGTSPLSIVSVRATCGCTTPEYSRKPVAPGDTAIISVAYDPAGRPGRFSKQIFVETTGQPAKTSLEISGVVIGSDESVGRRYPVDFGPLKLMKPVYSLGDATMGRLKTVYLEGYNRSADSLHIKIDNIPPYLDVVVAPQIAPPGEQVTLIAYVAPHKGAQYGVVEDTLIISPAPGMRYELPVLMTVNEDFSKLEPSKMEKAPIAVPETERIELGRVNRNGGPLITGLKLTNAGKDDLKIRRVYSVDRGVTAKASSESVKKGKSAEITVTIDPSKLQGAILNTRLQIITNDPLHPVYTVRIVGEWIE